MVHRGAPARLSPQSDPPVLGLWAPRAGLGSARWHERLQAVNRRTFRDSRMGLCGTCHECKDEFVGVPSRSDATTSIEIHSIEPSPRNYRILQAMQSETVAQCERGKARCCVAACWQMSYICCSMPQACADTCALIRHGCACTVWLPRTTPGSRSFPLSASFRPAGRSMSVCVCPCATYIKDMTRCAPCAQVLARARRLLNGWSAPGFAGAPTARGTRTPAPMTSRKVGHLAQRRRLLVGRMCVPLQSTTSSRHTISRASTT